MAACVLSDSIPVKLTIAYRMGNNKTAIGVFSVSELILLGRDRIDKQINKYEVRE